jgi:hypothetical protein
MASDEDRYGATSWTPEQEARDQRFADRLLAPRSESGTLPPLVAPTDMADADLAFARNILGRRVERSTDT